jgi:hypothetical protein
MRDPEYFEGELFFVRHEDNDEVLAVFAHLHKAEDFADQHSGAEVHEEEGVFYRTFDYEDQPSPWEGPFDSLAEAEEHLTEAHPDLGSSDEDADEFGGDLDPDEYGDFF